MPEFIIDTTETIHGRYKVIAANEDDARSKFGRGEILLPDLYEATDVEINYVVEVSDNA